MAQAAGGHRRCHQPGRGEALKRPALLRIHRATEPREVLLDGKPLAKGEQWRYDASAQRLIIRTRSYFDGEYAVR